MYEQQSPRLPLGQLNVARQLVVVSTYKLDLFRPKTQPRQMAQGPVTNKDETSKDVVRLHFAILKIDHLFKYPRVHLLSLLLPFLTNPLLLTLFEL